MDGRSGMAGVVFLLHPGSTVHGPPGAEVLFVCPWCPEKLLSTWFSPGVFAALATERT
jgi:hypothetical protein